MRNLHRYLVTETTPTERQALREAIQREHRGHDADRAGILLRGQRHQPPGRRQTAQDRRSGGRERIRHLLQTVCCWLAAACLFIAWGVAGSVEWHAPDVLGNGAAHDRLDRRLRHLRLDRRSDRTGRAERPNGPSP